ncbi:phosphoribosyltransferase domain-containing protein [Vibrio owensii]|uniref:phosphoribosyltransferase domain-containing protein n=1 Tax=Vibrio owensii TaxID=696485 RepID=UPI0038CEDD6D
MDYKYKIRAGEINLHTKAEQELLDRIVSFGCRENPKRHFMLINKLLGRYTPTSPSVMRSTYNILAEKIGSGKSTYVVSFAEAATGLGAGVADSLSNQQDEPVYFQHTTRHEISYPIWFTLDEKHSHAVDHIFYRPSAETLEDILSIRRLVVIDDEITTGRTIKVLLNNLVKKLPLLEEIVIASIMQLNKDLGFLKENLTGIKFKVINLIEANLTMISSKNYKPRLPNRTNFGLSKLQGNVDFGRLAIKLPVELNLNQLISDKSAIIIADGEFQYIPFLIAEKLESSGVSVEFQSINRSPLSVCNHVKNKIAISNYENNADNYIYNFFPEGKNVFVTSELFYESLIFHDSVEYHHCL